MFAKKPDSALGAVVIERRNPTALVERASSLSPDELVDNLERLLNAPEPQTLAIEQVRGLLKALVPLAREGLRRRDQPATDERDPDLPPVDEGEGGGSGGDVGTCGSCSWCKFVRDTGGEGFLCTIDPPVIWKGENMWRYLRPEVEESTPACSRRKPRSRS